VVRFTGRPIEECRIKIMNTRRTEFLAGARAVIPLIAGAVPFGLIYGVSALNAHISPVATQAMSSIVFAGSAQFVAVQLIGASVPALVIIATITIVNLRHALYSASLAPAVRDIRPAWWRWLLAYLLTDEAYAVTITRYQSDDPSPYRHWFFFGAGLGLWVSWQASTAIGTFLGASVPASWNLDFALPLTFIALVVPALHDRARILTALVAGILAILAGSLPLKLGLIVATLSGITAGMLLNMIRRKGL
jgi:4-azaleucine resistance transporter AzlC